MSFSENALSICESTKSVVAYKLNVILCGKVQTAKSRKYRPKTDNAEK